MINIDRPEYPDGHRCAELRRRNERIVVLVTVFAENTITVRDIVSTAPAYELKYEDVTFCPHCGVDIEKDCQERIRPKEPAPPPCFDWGC